MLLHKWCYFFYTSLRNIISLYEVVSGLSNDVYKCTRGREMQWKRFNSLVFSSWLVLSAGTKQIKRSWSEKRRRHYWRLQSVLCPRGSSTVSMETAVLAPAAAWWSFSGMESLDVQTKVRTKSLFRWHKTSVQNKPTNMVLFKNKIN